MTDEATFVGIAGASAPNPESKLGFLAAVALLQFFIPLAEDDAVVVRLLGFVICEAPEVDDDDSGPFWFELALVFL